MKQDLKEGKKEENNENSVVAVVIDELLFACDKDVINFVSQDKSWIVILELQYMSHQEKTSFHHILC